MAGAGGLLFPLAAADAADSMGPPRTPTACRPRLRGATAWAGSGPKGLAGARVCFLSGRSALADGESLRHPGPLHRAVAQPSPHVHATSPGAGRAAQGGLTAKSRLSAEPRGLPTPWGSCPRQPPAWPPAPRPTAPGVEPQGLQLSCVLLSGISWALLTVVRSFWLQH